MMISQTGHNKYVTGMESCWKSPAGRVMEQGKLHEQGHHSITQAKVKKGFLYACSEEGMLPFVPPSLSYFPFSVE